MFMGRGVFQSQREHLVDKLHTILSFRAIVVAGTNGNRSFECKPGTRVIHLV